MCVRESLCVSSLVTSMCSLLSEGDTDLKDNIERYSGQRVRFAADLHKLDRMDICRMLGYDAGTSLSDWQGARYLC